MALQRALGASTSSTLLLFRFAAQMSSAPCNHSLRAFSSIHPQRMSTKRKMQTSTVYKPSTLPTGPLPPRNATVPETSVAGGIPQVNDTMPPKMTQQHEPLVVSQTRSTIYLAEREAQQLKLVPESTEKPRRKLRARKAAMNLTPGAVKQLRTLLNQPSPKLIKVGVKNRGCSGLAYSLEFVDKAGAFDETVEQDGVKVLIDSKALFSIIGSEMDWVEDKLNQRFVFKNPNIKEQCGCGESFMV